MKQVCIIFSLSIFCLVLFFIIGSVQSFFYPMSYKTEIEEVSQKYNIDGALIASVINVESGFNEKAISNKGAVGIMQIMPSTAKWIAQKNKIDYDEKMLENPYYNIQIGSIYLSYLINYFNDKELGICAYNAGQGNVSNWLKARQYSKDGKTLDTIPFNETKDYLNKVNKNYYYYKNRYK